jgi:hypothetical protein
MASLGNIRELIEVSQDELLQKIEFETHIIRAGASIDCDKRANSYEGELYSGVMFYARTQNMMKAEDKLLKAGWKNGNCKHNLQEFSNAQEGPGFVYIRGGQPTARGHFFALEAFLKCPSNIFRNL